MRGRRSLLLVAPLAAALLFSSCGGGAAARSPSTTAVERLSSPATPTTAVKAPTTPLTLAEIRQQYLSATALVTAPFNVVVTQIGQGAPGTSVRSTIDAVDRLASAIKRSAVVLTDLKARAPKQVAHDLNAVLQQDDVVYQGVLLLAQDYGGRGFDLSAWESGFQSAVAGANAAADTLRKAIGLPQLPTGGSGNSGSGNSGSGNSGGG